ncbi:hypothetical protein [Turicimonas muris]|nr:hypothetical protein [Turicimonas muris]MBS4768239.1 hypothetical protein [Burkholderiales bacterium]QQQ96921.1 hypothetical protein I5Q81_00675 [Turicimonas muris]
MGYDTTKHLLDSGKVFCCASDEKFITDERVAKPCLTEEKNRSELD